ncbi:MAG TPA: lytic transglycosylase domain-containing protein [Stellaceae bacterium]|nr:lytic transglycosylase domain-containing protein [Stellaceae bacterium]
MVLLLPLFPLAAAPAQAELSSSDRQIYREAFQAARSGDWATAGLRADKAQDGLLAKVLWWLNLTRDGSGATFAEISEFISANPDWPSPLVLRQHAEESAVGVSDKTLSDWYDRFPPVTAAGKLRQAQIWINAGREEDGKARIRDVWINSDLSVFEEKTLLQRYHGVLREEDHVARLDRLLWDGRSDAARRMFPYVSADYRALADARLKLAHLSRGLEKALAAVPASLQNDAGLLYERMHWRNRKGHADEAVAILDHAPEDLVRPAAWANERQSLGRYALATGDFQLAYRLAARHGLTSGPVYAELEFLAGWLALRFLHEPDRAYNHFVGLYEVVKLPVSVARASYWAGRAADAMGYDQLAATWYRTAAEHLTTYYGQLAATALGEPQLARALDEPTPTAAESEAFDNQELVKALHQLSEIGATEYMRPFVLRLSELAKSPGDHALIAHLALQIDRPDLAITVAKKASYAGVVLLAEGYPLSELPPGGSVEHPLVLAMTRQESAFDRGAVSSAGALGLMQVMPATAKHIARALRMRFDKRRLTTDRHYNVTIGRAYLDGLLGDFSGSYVLAIAAYNAGPNRVRQWIRDYGDPRSKDVDVIDWIESIPIGETRNYVQRVLENLQLYRLRMGDQSLGSSLATDLKR